MRALNPYLTQVTQALAFGLTTVSEEGPPSTRVTKTRKKLVMFIASQTVVPGVAFWSPRPLNPVTT